MSPQANKFVVSFVHPNNMNLVNYLQEDGQKEWSDSSRNNPLYIPAYSGDYNLIFARDVNKLYIAQIISRKPCNVENCIWKDSYSLIGRDHLKLSKKIYTMTHEEFLTYFGDIIKNVHGTSPVYSELDIAATLEQFENDKKDESEWTVVKKKDKKKIKAISFYSR